MIEVIYWTIVLLLVLRRNSKFLLCWSFFLMAILFCFNYDNVDRGIYEMRLNDYESMEGMTEIGYYYLMQIFTNLHLDVQYLYGLVGLLYLGSLMYIINKLSDAPGFPIAFYMSCIFFLDVVQLRNTLSLVFVLWAFYLFFTIPEKRKSQLLYLVFVLAASMFHSSNIVFGIFVLAKEPHKKVIRYTIIAIAVLSSLQYLMISYLGDIYSMGQKIEQISTSDRYTGNNMNLIVIIWLFMLLLTYAGSYFFVGRYQDDMKDGEDALSFREIGLNITILLTTIIPLVFFSADFRRIYYAISVILVCIMSHWLREKRRWIVVGTVALLAYFYLFRFTAGEFNKPVVYDMIFNANLLLD